MRIVITGASGFIGQTLIKFLFKKKITTIGYTRKKMRGLITIPSYEVLPFHENSILIHLAQNPNTTSASSSREIDLCQYFTTMPWKHVIFSSSAIVYGDQMTHARTPDERLNPISSYAQLKLNCEEVFNSIGATCLRLSNVYGPNMTKGTVISDILSQIPSSSSLRLLDRTSVRDFIWSEDATSAFISAIENMPGCTLNVGSGRSLAVSEIARIALNLAKEQSRSIVYENENKNKSKIFLDISKTQSLLNWTPKTNIETGISTLLANRLC